MTTLSNWLPVGQHWGLHITHKPAGGGLAYTGGGNKLVWHTTEGPFSGADETLRANGDEPHFLIDPKSGYVVQYMSVMDASRSLKHPAGTPATNTANCVQVEVADYAKNVRNWTQLQYRHLGALAALITHRVSIPSVSPSPNWLTGRFQADRFVTWSGHCGHMHVPNNDHVDPGLDFSPHSLFEAMRLAEKTYN